MIKEKKASKPVTKKTQRSIKKEKKLTISIISQICKY